MEPDESSSKTRRKIRFAPKAPTQRKLKTTHLKKEFGDEDKLGALEARTLLRQFKENHSRRVSKPEKKTQVAFGGGGTNSSVIRSFGSPKEERESKTDKHRSKGFDDGKIPKLSSSNVAEKFESFETYVSFENVSNGATQLQEKTYKEPWDYKHSYYPTVLPLRRPHSGDPAILDAEEFGNINKVYDEDSINSASELGLTDEKEQGKMLLFQLPSTFPIFKRPASTKGKEKHGSSSSNESQSGPTKRVKLGDLPAGYVGKMLVYKSGEVKLRIGNILYDVSPGSDITCAQDVMAINTAKKHCCALGDLEKRAIVTPDLDHLLHSVIDLG